MRSTRGLPAAAGPAVVALALATLGACTAGGSPSGSAPDGKSPPLDGSTVSPAPPGKYQTLPQPCAAVDVDSLKQLVPGAKDYAGTESLTYDTDRGVGCLWRGLASDGTARSLRVGFERVVSYDPGISDEVQAESDFYQQAVAASITLSPTTAATATPTTASPTATGTGAGTGTGTATATGTASGTTAGTGSGGSSGSSSSQDLAPRALTDVGDTAFLNDVLKTKTRAGGPRRDVTVVFRTANVLVTVVYSQAEPRGGPSPQSADLQQGAQDVAAQLEGKVDR